MICANNPQPDDVELLLTLDGEASPEVAMHVSHCPQCSQRAAELASAQRLATARLFRAACPSALELGEYHLGMLPAASTTAVQQHLATCPHCTGELAQLAAFMDSPDPYLHPAPWTTLRQQVNVLVARLASGMQASGLFGSPALAPALAGLRGAAGGPLTYEAGDAQIILETQRDGQRVERYTLVGLVMGMDGQALQATLWREEQRIVSVAVDDLGNFTMHDLTPGQYELILAGPRDEVHIQSLHV
jgi:hypothetical protein